MMVRLMLVLVVALVTANAQAPSVEAPPPQVPYTVTPGTSVALEFYTGNKLLSHCQSAEEYSKAACLSYVMGVADTVGDQQNSSTKSGPMWRIRYICFPADLDAGQVRDVVVKYLVENPETRNQQQP